MKDAVRQNWLKGFDIGRFFLSMHVALYSMDMSKCVGLVVESPYRPSRWIDMDFCEK